MYRYAVPHRSTYPAGSLSTCKVLFSRELLLMAPATGSVCGYAKQVTAFRL